MVSRTEGGSLFPSKKFDAELSSRISVEEFETWFHGVRFSYEAPDVVRVIAPGRFQCMWIERHFAAALRESVRVAFNIQATLAFKALDSAGLSSEAGGVDLSSSTGALSSLITGEQGREGGGASEDTTPDDARDDLGSPTLQDHCFERFVVGSPNRMAYAAALSVSESPGHPYNPLIIYGGSGLGKSHLLQSCHQKLEVEGDHKALYLTGEAFINLCKAHSGDDSRSLRDRLRDYDALVVDGVQWIARDERFQEIFSLIVHDFCDNGRQLVLSADTPPWEIPDVTPRLASRLKTGLVTRLDPLTFELKVDLLQKKAAVHGLKLSDDIAETLARGVGESPCLVEGLIKQLVSMVQLQEGPGRPSPNNSAGGAGRPLLPTTSDSALNVAEETSASTSTSGAGVEDREVRNGPAHVLDGLPALSRLLQIELPSKRLEICDIHKAVANYYGLRRADILSSSRKNSLVLARQVAMYLSRHLTQHSFGEIGSYFGGRDHATVIYAVKKITRLTVDDAVVGQDLERISRSLGSLS